MTKESYYLCSLLCIVCQHRRRAPILFTYNQNPEPPSPLSMHMYVHTLIFRYSTRVCSRTLAQMRVCVCVFVCVCVYVYIYAYTY
jgi:hypothetical protein